MGVTDADSENQCKQLLLDCMHHGAFFVCGKVIANLAAAAASVPSLGLCAPDSIVLYILWKQPKTQKIQHQ